MKLDIKDLITEHKLDVLYLVETDTNSINEEKDYKLKGFKTVFHLKKDSNNKTRMICLVNEECDNITIILLNTDIQIIKT